MIGDAQKAAGRSSRRRNLDPRLFIGIGLVVVSVIGVVTIVSTVDETVAVYAANGTLTPGEQVTAADLVIRDVRLEGLDGLYLRDGDLPDDGVVISRAVGEGELIPLSAVEDARRLDFTPVVITVDGGLGASVVAGARVDVWAAARTSGGGFDPPAIIASAATVVRLVESDSLVSGNDTVGVEVLVSTEELSRVLTAVTNTAAISVVPAALGAEAER